MFKRLVDTITFILQCIIVGLIFAYLRHNFRLIYYPLKWFLTMIMTLMFLSFGLVVFKLLNDIIFGSGSSLEWFSKLMYDIGTSHDLLKAGLIFAITLLVFGTPVRIFIDKVIYQIELQIYGSVWSPTRSQNFWWNLWGFSSFVLLWFRLLTF
jgi:hypothetical protein